MKTVVEGWILDLEEEVDRAFVDLDRVNDVLKTLERTVLKLKAEVVSKNEGAN
jgi:hypothetical protein